jgi:calcium/calmodulin-dependent protein kinase I
MLNKLHGQPDSYDKKFAAHKPLLDDAKYTEHYNRRSKYVMGKTLGAGTYGIVREAQCPEGKVAVKIILKKNVKGNEQMVYDELEMLQRMKHTHIVRFHDWFESRVCLVARSVEVMLMGLLGQVLHRHPACYGWRAVR